MINATDHTHTHDHMCCKKRLSWSAIIAGALVGIGLSFLLNLFSIAIGLSIFNTATEGAVTLAIGGFIGVIIGTIVPMFFAGFTAGYLGRPHCARRNLGVLYGFTAWCLALILTALFTTHMGHYVSSYGNFVSNPSAVVVTSDSGSAGVTTSPATPAPQSAVMVIDAQRAANGLAMGTFLIFVLFSIGALSSAIGGHCGMRCCREDEVC